VKEKTIARAILKFRRRWRKIQGGEKKKACDAKPAAR
jgi:hypothetical protein